MAKLKSVGLNDFKIEMVPIDQLRPYPQNAKAHPEAQVAKIAASLKEYGIAKNIVINADNEIICGHGSVLAYQKLGVGVVPCRRMTHLSPVQERGLRLSDNRSAESSWFPETLALELKALEEMDFDLGLTGFDLDELEGFGIGQGGDPHPEDPGPQIDRAAELQEKWKTERGQIWELPSKSAPGKAHRVMCGDSTSAEDVGRLMGGIVADILFTDPPYGISVVGAEGNIGGDTKNAKAGKYQKIIGDSKPFSPNHLFLLAKKILLWGANYYCLDLPCPGQWIVWDKNRPDGTTFSECELAWTNGKGIAIKKYKCTWDGFHKEGESGDRMHPTQKPIQLTKEILSGIEGETVIDCYLGSGTTLIAAEQLGRVCYGMEISEAYTAVILQRAADMGLTPKLTETTELQAAPNA